MRWPFHVSRVSGFSALWEDGSDEYGRVYTSFGRGAIGLSAAKQ